MKINFLKSTMLAGILVLTGCSSEEIIDGATSGMSLQPGENLVKISLTSTTTRSPRPIGSTEADNNIDRIAFKLVSTTTGDMTDAPIEGVYTTENGDKNPSGYTVQDNVIKLPEQNEVTVYIRFSTTMAEGRYNIVAYGYNSDGNADGFPYTMAAATSSTEYMPISCTVGADDVVEEIFAGYCTVYVNQHGKFTTQPVINMKRQVAALLAYMGDVPAYVGTTKVAKVVISTYASITGFKIPAAYLSSATDNGIFGDKSGTTRVNLLEFTLTGASNYRTASPGATYTFSGDAGERYLLADGMAEIEDLVCADHTLFGSCFLLPYGGTFDLSGSGKAPLNIEYLDEAGNTILLAPLKNGGDMGYKICCNYIYSIGSKTSVEEAGTPANIDEASGFSDMELSITENWDNTVSLIK